MNKFDQPLKVLREKVLAGGDFSAIMAYFFDHCGEQPDFLALGKAIEHPKLAALLPQILAAACKERVKITMIKFTSLPEAKFIHGGFMVGWRPGLVIYFEEIDRGVVALLGPGGKETDFVRFSCQTLGSGNLWQ